MKRFLLLLILLSVMPRVYAQDLDRLRQRSSALWVERIKQDRAKALQYVLPASRSDFSMYEFVREAQVVGFEFIENSSKVLVTTKAKLNILPPFDKLEKTIGETWEWTNGNWFVRAIPADPNAFARLPGASAPIFAVAGTTSLQFDLVEDQVNLGQHKQGDSVEGTVHFTASHSQVSSVRIKGIPGTRIKELRWNADNNGGLIDFVLDTTLLSANAQLTAVFVAMGPPVGATNPSTEDTLRLSLGISGQVRIQQVPAVIDSMQAGRAAIEIQNVSEKPFSIRGIQSISQVFTLAGGDIPPSIQPGQTVKFLIDYKASAQPVGAEFYLAFSPGVLPNDSLTFPLSVLEPEPAPTPTSTGFTREELDAIARRENQRRGR